jgi:LysM repeat protein
MKKIGSLFFFFSFTSLLTAQKISIEEYVNTYKDIAMKEMIRSGVPASITLAQGILETESGNSALVKKSNNHFGIKCKETWTGPSVSHDDDAPQECFRKYEDAIASYMDHSDFLRTRKHYHFLFDLDPLDYKAWAHGLKKAGYATNPKYPQILIKYIETYNLHDYSLLAMGKKPAVQQSIPRQEAPTTIAKNETAVQLQPKSEDIVVAINPPQLPVNDVVKEIPKPIPKENVENVTQSVVPATVKEIATVQPESSVTKETPPVIAQAPSYPSGEFKINETRVVYAAQGTSWSALASSYNLPLKYLYDFNDMNAEVESLSQSQLIYLQRKRRTGAATHHIVQPGESLHDIAQKQGIRLEALLTLNRLSKDHQPVAGQKLYLQTEAPATPPAESAMIEVGQHVGASETSAASDEYEVHVVQPKQTLYALSKQYNVSIQTLMQWNNLSGTDIKEGMELIVSQKDYNVYKSTR